MSQPSSDTDSQITEGGEKSPSGDSGTSDNAGSSGDSKLQSGENIQWNEDFDFNMNDVGRADSSLSDLIWLAASVLILVSGLIIAKLYKY